MTLEEVADELYGLPPEQFTATRQERVAQARADGERELARQVHALRRPTRTAWLANLLVRRAGEPMEELLGLGAAMRTAQQDLAGEQLRRLGQQRHRVIAALTQQARTQTGTPVTDTVARELEATLEAALADPAAADAVRTGRLVRALVPNGLDPVELDGAVAAPELGVPAGLRRPPRPAASAADQDDCADGAARREHEAAARAEFERAQAAAEQADEAERAAEQRLADAREAERRAGEQLADLERRLEQARGDQQAAAQQRRDRQTERDQATREARTAARALQRAKAALGPAGQA